MTEIIFPAAPSRGALSRRQLILLCAILPLLRTLGKQDTLTAAAANSSSTLIQPRSLIDIHGHIFNAQDLPIDGFLVDVIAGGAFWAGKANDLGVIAFLKWLLVGSGKSYDEEKKYLDTLLGQAKKVVAPPDANAAGQFLEGRVSGLVPGSNGSTARSASHHIDLLRFASVYFDSRPLPFAAGDADLAEVVQSVDPSSPEYRAEALRYVYRHYVANDKAHFDQQKDQYQSSVPATVRDRLKDPARPFAAGEPAPLTEVQQRNVDRLAQTMRDPLAGVGTQMASSQSDDSSLWSWAAQFDLYRVQLAQILGSKFNGTPSSAKFYAVSTVDYQFWLGSQEKTPASLPEQADLVSKISALVPGGKLFHGFYGFDPLRALVEEVEGIEPERRALAVAQRAVRQKGFLGIKLYPPMGFSPIGNSALSNPEFGPRANKLLGEFDEVGHPVARLGAELDRKLYELYDWCVAEDVPILAHCSPSQYSFKAAAFRASPYKWEQLVGAPGAASKYKKLRLNIAHFGGVWCLGKIKETEQELANNACNEFSPLEPDFISPNETLPNLLSKTWTGKVVSMLSAGADGAYPNLYGDLADSGAVSNPKEHMQWEATYTNLRTLLTALPKAGTRMLYGTDWSMLGRDRGFQDYYVRMLEQMNRLLADVPALGPDFIDGFFWRNSARYLGIIGEKVTSSPPATRQRLNDFHKNNPEAIAVLNSLNA